MRAETIETLDGVKSIEDVWRSLAEARGNPFVSPEWFRSSIAHLADSAAPKVVAVYREDGSLMGVMPFVLDASRRPAAIRFAGATFGDRLHPAAAEADEVEVASAAVEALAGELRQRILLLEKVDAEAEWWQAMQRSAPARLARIEQQPSELPFVHLEGLDWDGYLAKRSSNFRQQVRRRERALHRDHRVEVRTATESSLEADLDRLFELHEARWDSRDGSSSLQAPAARRFLKDFAGAAFGRGWLRLRLLEVDGTAVAGFFGWRLGPSFAFYQSGFDPAWADKSVGVVLMAATIRSAIEEGASEFDMLLGTEAYKRRFTDDSRPVQTVILVGAKRPLRLVLATEARARRLGKGLASRPAMGKIARGLARLLPTSRRS